MLIFFRGPLARQGLLSKMGNLNPFKPLLEPRSVAVVGASSDPVKPGYTLLKNIIEGGFRGGIYPINPRGGVILGRRAYPSVLEVPGDLDLVFILIPRQQVPGLLLQCGEKGVKGAVVVTAGFGEVGELGAAEAQALQEAIQRSRVRVVGPNTIGLINAHHRLIASFIPFTDWLPGDLSLFAQTGNFAGAMANQLMDQASQRIGIGKSVSVGNKMDLDEVDFLDYVAADPETRVIGLHLESLPRPREFFERAREVAREKPIVLIKPGRTPQGARAARFHTGAPEIEDAKVEEACRRAGIIRVKTFEEFLGALKALSFQPLPKGRRVCVITMSGGSGVLVSDELYEAGFELPELSEATVRQLQALLPDWQPVRNPADLWVAMTGDNRGVQGGALRAAMLDDATDAAIIIFLGIPPADFEGIAEEYRAAMELRPDKPILSVFIGGKTADKWMRELEGLKVPVYRETSQAVKALLAMRLYAERRL